MCQEENYNSPHKKYKYNGAKKHKWNVHIWPHVAVLSIIDLKDAGNQDDLKKQGT